MFSDEMRGKLLHTKFNHWNYEQEARRAIELTKCKSEGRLNFFEFDDTLLLREVILGHLCNLSVEVAREFVAVHYPKAVVFKARLAFKTFNVVPLGTSVP